MNQEEYTQAKEKLTRQNTQTPVMPDEVVAIQPEDIKQMEAETSSMITPEELEEMEDKPITGKNLRDVDLKPIEEYPELCDILQTPEAQRLGTKARIPILLSVQGRKFRVYVRALNTEEIVELQNNYSDENEINHQGVLLACTNKDGVPYKEEEILQMGYVNERRISEAIAIVSGASTDTDDAEFQEQVREQFQKQA